MRRSIRVQWTLPAWTMAGALVLVALAPLSAGCGRQAIATTDALPVQRVVVYRNGVAYFERAGHVDKDDVRFKMKRTEVGDFLATLAVMERDGSSVRSAAFPLKNDDDDDRDRDPDGGKPLTEDEKKGLETVVLSLDGKAHDLQVGYVAESPVWKASYRLVIQPNGEADLQAWGIVENLSGEDWKDVRLSLIAGAPLAFEADLGTAVIPPRPMVTDQGEVIAAVPRGETSLRQQDEAPPPPPPPAPSPVSASAPKPEEDVDQPMKSAASGGAAHEKKDAYKGGGAGRGPRLRSAGPRPMASAAPPFEPADNRAMAGEMAAGAPPPVAISPPRNLRSLAAVAAEGGATRYDLPLPVTIPDRSATMVLLLSRRVPGEALYLYAPDGGVPDSSSHPFRVARFTNAAAGVLERGPIAVFERGAFLGQGMLDPLPQAATATVPFALERAVAVDQSRKEDEIGARVAKIENSELTVERDEVVRTTYRIRSGSDEASKILVRHPRIGGARLFSPPAGTEDNVGTGTALVPTKIAAHATVDLVVDERTTIQRSTDWFGAIADAAVRAYIADPKADRAASQKLSAAWAVRNEIVRASEDRSKLQQQYATLGSASQETRLNLAAIEKNKTADALRQKLTARLAETASRMDDLNRKIVELDALLAERSVQFKEAIREVSVNAPSPS